MGNTYVLTIDSPIAGTLALELRDSTGALIRRTERAFSGHVDNLLLTAVDNLLEESRVDRFALKAVELGSGIDKTSSFYRIVQSFASAVAAAR